MSSGPPMMRALALLAVLAAEPLAASGEPLYPHLRLIAPAAPGGGWDQTARAMQAAFQESGIVSTSSVENVPGAAGTIGLARFISAERGSGDALMISGLIMLGAVVTHQSPVTLREVTPIARLTGEFEVVVVPAASSIRTLDELVAMFRARPASVSWGGGSAGGTDQIVAGLIADAVGVEPRWVNYIAYAGGGESLSAILGGQVTAGISGLAEFAPHLEAGTLRALAISSETRVPGVDIPTFKEQGVDVAIENWRSVVAPPGVSAAERQRLEQAVDQLVQSAAWKATLERYRWSDRYLPGTAFARFVAAEEARVEGILARLGTGPSSDATASDEVGRYPLLIVLGLVVTAAWSARDLLRGRASKPDRGAADGSWRAVALVGVAALADLLLLDTLGFVIASSVLFWVTARAFDATRPWRDLVLSILLAVGAWLLFVRLLQVSLPAGPLAGYL